MLFSSAVLLIADHDADTALYDIYIQRSSALPKILKLKALDHTPTSLFSAIYFRRPSTELFGNEGFIVNFAAQDRTAITVSYKNLRVTIKITI